MKQPCEILGRLKVTLVLLLSRSRKGFFDMHQEIRFYSAGIYILQGRAYFMDNTSHLAINHWIFTKNLAKFNGNANAVIEILTFKI